MKVEVLEHGAIVVTLSESNLDSLKEHRYAARQTDLAYLAVRVEPDDVHYKDRPWAHPQENAGENRQARS